MPGPPATRLPPGEPGLSLADEGADAFREIGRPDATREGRQLRIELDPATSQVTIINAGDKNWLKALQDLKL